jgi:PAS domain S-box-containing protein
MTAATVSVRPDTPGLPREQSQWDTVALHLREFPELAGLACGTAFAALVLDGTYLSWRREAELCDAVPFPNHRAFDERVLSSGELCEVPDARAGGLTASELAFYIGAPLRAADGRTVGILAVFDTTATSWGGRERAVLLALARQAGARAALADELLRLRAKQQSAPDTAYLLNLQQLEMLNRNTFEQAPIGIAYADREGCFQRVNPAFASMLGYRTDELEGMPIGKLTHEADFEHNSTEIGRLWRREIESYSLEKRYVRKDGTPVWVRVTAALVLDASGSPNCSVGFLETISDRKNAELELERTHKELLDASRLAGMAEVASNVLHNIGNVLTSVNVSANLVAECVKDAKVAGLSRAAALLKEREQDLVAFLTQDERGRKLPVYLAQLGEHLQGNQRLALKELGALRDSIDHIKETVAMQQSYAKLCGVSEIIAVDSLIEDSLRMNAAALTRHGITVIREIEGAVPEVSVDKHKVLQILVNLIRNAKYACDDSGNPDKRITVRVTSGDYGVRIAVVDNGVGIGADTMSRLFRHGFTTRKTGHGFGLHSGALAAKELGGSLTAHSDGLGCGATFTLELPRGEKRG